MTSLLSLPDSILGHIYELLDSPADRRNFFHSCKALHEAEDITQRVRAVTLSYVTLETNWRYDLGANAVDSMKRFPSIGKLQVLRMHAGEVLHMHAGEVLHMHAGEVLHMQVRKGERAGCNYGNEMPHPMLSSCKVISCFELISRQGLPSTLCSQDLTNDGIFTIFSAFTINLKAREVLKPVHTLNLMGCFIDTDKLAVPLALMVSLLLPELQHLEFGSGSDPHVWNPLVPSFLSPHQPGGLGPASKLSQLKIEGITVSNLDSLLGNIGCMHNLTILDLKDFSVSARPPEIGDMRHTCDLAPLVHLQALQKLTLAQVGFVKNLDAVLQACGRLTELELASYEMPEPLCVSCASVSHIRLGANALYEHAECIDMSLFPNLKSVTLECTNNGMNGGPVAEEDAGQLLQLLHSAAKKVVTWPVSSWYMSMFYGLSGGSPQQQVQLMSDLLDALSPLAGSEAAACLECLDFKGKAQLQFFPPSFIRALADMFPNICCVMLYYASLDARSVMEVLKAFPYIEYLRIISNPGAPGLREGCVAAAAEARHTRSADLDVIVGGNPLFKGCQDAWSALSDAHPDAGSCAVNLIYDDRIPRPV